MRRKLVKIGESTLMLSLPREWVLANGLHKGDELEVNIDQDKLYVWPDSRARKEKMLLDVTEYSNSLPRLLYALYRSGVDELELKSKNPGLLGRVKSTVWKEAVGFEIIDQKEDSCKIICVSGKVDDFDKIVRRLFLVTLTMGEESIAALKKNSGFENALYLEQENNRLTNVLIRAINKYGSHGHKKIVPIYYIVQELEKIGDQCKYLAQFMEKKGKRVRARAIALLEKSVELLRLVYELFYTFNQEKSNMIRDMREAVVKGIIAQYGQKNSEEENIVLHHSLNIATRSFDMVSSVFILKIQP